MWACRGQTLETPVLLDCTLNNQLISELALAARLQSELTSSAGSLAGPAAGACAGTFGFGFLGDCRASVDTPA